MSKEKTARTRECADSKRDRLPMEAAGGELHQIRHYVDKSNFESTFFSRGGVSYAQKYQEQHGH